MQPWYGRRELLVGTVNWKDTHLLDKISTSRHRRNDSRRNMVAVLAGATSLAVEWLAGSRRRNQLLRRCSFVFGVVAVKATVLAILFSTATTYTNVTAVVTAIDSLLFCRYGGAARPQRL